MTCRSCILYLAREKHRVGATAMYALDDQSWDPVAVGWLSDSGHIEESYVCTKRAYSIKLLLEGIAAKYSKQ